MKNYRLFVLFYQWYRSLLERLMEISLAIQFYSISFVPLFNLFDNISEITFIVYLNLMKCIFKFKTYISIVLTDFDILVKKVQFIQYNTWYYNNVRLGLRSIFILFPVFLSNVMSGIILWWRHLNTKIQFFFQY